MTKILLTSTCNKYETGNIRYCFPGDEKTSYDGADPKCRRSPGSSAFPCLGWFGARGAWGTMDVALPDHVLSVGKQTNLSL